MKERRPAILMKNPQKPLRSMNKCPMCRTHSADIRYLGHVSCCFYAVLSCFSSLSSCPSTGPPYYSYSSLLSFLSMAFRLPPPRWGIPAGILRSERRATSRRTYGRQGRRRRHSTPYFRPTGSSGGSEPGYDASLADPPLTSHALSVPCAIPFSIDVPRQ